MKSAIFRDLDDELQGALQELDAEKDNYAINEAELPEKNANKSKKREKIQILEKSPSFREDKQELEENIKGISSKELLFSPSREKNQGEMKRIFSFSSFDGGEVDYGKEVKDIKMKEIEMFIKTLEENIENNVMGEMPCGDRLRAFMEQTEMKLKEFKYPWHKVFFHIKLYKII